ncbi:hypothetical protein HHI36_019353 [Cryptolaemus montrouzieri]|uniref:Uncharacterized protein n=1 Tax=Cryptolaemus montrouzieri TaxID=559131 RepID=A0ABD2P304_9CUCU
MVKNRDSHYLKQQFKIQDRDTKNVLKRQKENSSKINYKVQRVTVKTVVNHKNLENKVHLQANDIRERESEDGTVTTCRKQISTILNNHFVTVGANLAKKINSHNPGRLERKVTNLLHQQ